MEIGRLWLLLVLLVAPLCRAGLLDYTDELPPCGIGCLATEIPASDCGTFTNETCICSSEDLHQRMEVCLSEKCKIIERLAVAKIDEKACNKPKRHETTDIPIFIVVDLIALGLIFLRFYMRWTKSARLEADDIVIGIMFVFWIIFQGLGLQIRIHAIGRDIWDLEPETITMTLKLFFIDEIFYFLVLALGRAGILLFLLRVFPSAQFQRWVYLVMAWVAVTTVLFLFLTIFQCMPIDFNWLGWTGDYDRPHECRDVNAQAYAAAAVGIAQDIVIMLLPLPQIFGLQMSLKKKLMTVFIFSLGIFVVITSCIRLHFLMQFAKSENATWDNTDSVVWTHAEVSVTVLVLTMPSLRAALAQFFPALFGSSSQPSAISRTGGRSRSNAGMPAIAGGTGLGTTASASRATRYTHREQKGFSEVNSDVDVELGHTFTSPFDGSDGKSSPWDEPEHGRRQEGASPLG